MKKQITISLVQPDLLWEDPEGNVRQLDEMIRKEIHEPTDLIILPETFSTGFTMRSDLFAEEEGGATVTWMKSIADERNCYITGSLIMRDKGVIRNRLYWVSPEGIEGYYDKRHLFRPGGERENFSQGNERKIFQLGPFRFLPQICYDLRFPVFSRNRGDYDVMLYVANWPASRQQVWETLTRARAMENQSYLLATNRVGTDGTGVASIGGTCAIDPTGGEIQRMDDRPGIESCLLDLEVLRNFRKRFPVWKDADRFEPGWEPDRLPDRESATD